MKRATVLLAVFAAAGFGQEPAQGPPMTDLTALSDQLQAAIGLGDWKKAAALSSAHQAATDLARDQSFSKGNAVLVDQLLKWLPADTETLAVSAAPLSPWFHPSNREPANALVAATGYLLSLLESLEEGKIAKRLERETLSLSAIAARRFQNHDPSPSGALPLGMIAYQGCAFYAFSNAVPPSTFEGLPAAVISGRTTWTAEGKDYEPAGDAPASADIHFLALLRPDVLTVCTDKAFFTTVLSRLNGKGPSRALPDSLPEWKQLDRSAPFWALRHFDPKRASEDPTLSELAAVSPNSFGVTLQIGRANTARFLRFLGKSPENPFAEMKGDPQFASFAIQQIKPGIWQVSGGTSAEADSMFTFFAMGLLGFAVLI